ncbi:MAG: nucleotidyltransferase domain-containing protein [Candidatus Aenigmarchaeota archaeon]|nr:nucleotidyltransferase domain-containing protein [Candidatus Aenigmarchaeota archaeon]MBU5689463.1 nucleotidyltransferase domain-containing protein [Candidatus Aenigmarchaeota archaeon]
MIDKIDELTKEKVEKYANEFKEKVLKKYGDRIKCIVMMGSAARNEFKKTSDIDLFVVIDDTETPIDPNEKAKIDSDILSIAQEISPALSFQPLYTLTEFMEYARIAHPIIYNFIKDGKILYDVGFFAPFQRLLHQGKIPITREAIETYMNDAPKKINRAKTVKLLMLTEDCFYAILNTAQAILMFLGIEPPSPNKAYEEFKKYLVDTGLVEEKYAIWLKDIVDIRKKIEHKEILDVTGAFVDEWIQKSEEFVNKMFELLSLLEQKKKEKVLEKTYEVMKKAVKEAIKEQEGKEIADNEIEDAFKKELVEKGRVDSHYFDVWRKISIMKSLMDQNKSDKIDAKEVYRMRDYVKNFIRDLARKT